MAEAAKKKKKLVKGRHASQIKRQKQSVKIHTRNVSIKSSIKTAIKKVREAVGAKNKDQAITLLKEAARSLQKGSSKGVLHARNVARKISRLSSLVNKL